MRAGGKIPRFKVLIMPINEYQKPFSDYGRLNAEVAMRKSYCGTAEPGVWCECDHCEGERADLKREVNKLMGYKFHKDV